MTPPKLGCFPPTFCSCFSVAKLSTSEFQLFLVKQFEPCFTGLVYKWSTYWYRHIYKLSGFPFMLVAGRANPPYPLLLRRGWKAPHSPQDSVCTDGLAFAQTQKSSSLGASTWCRRRQESGSDRKGHGRLGEKFQNRHCHLAQGLPRPAC